ncbi:MAG: PIN domain-containing protein [Tumebacillaceae bacterium]
MHRRSYTPVSPTGATSICFNDSLSAPFCANLLVDAGIFIAIFDEDDTWHVAVKDFFDTFVFDQEIGPRFFVTSDIINEYLHRVVENYESRTKLTASPAIRQKYADAIHDLINEGSVELIELDKTSTLAAITRWAQSSYGAKDAFHVSCQLHWGLDLITVDHNLMEELEQDANFHQKKVYYPSLSLRAGRRRR